MEQVNVASREDLLRKVNFFNKSLTLVLTSEPALNYLHETLRKTHPLASNRPSNRNLTDFQRYLHHFHE